MAVQGKRIYEGKFRKLHEAPLVFVPLLGHEEARWSQEFKRPSMGRVREKVLERYRIACEGEADLADAKWYVQGVCLMPSWTVSAMRGEPFEAEVDIEDTRQLMHNMLTLQCREGLRAVLEWPVTACAYLCEPQPYETSLDLSDYTLTLDAP
eukprot:6455238-Amphidinium_carterae.1